MLIHEETNQWNWLESPGKKKEKKNKFLSHAEITIKFRFQIGENMDYSINGVGTSG